MQFRVSVFVVKFFKVLRVDKLADMLSGKVLRSFSRPQELNKNTRKDLDTIPKQQSRTKSRLRAKFCNRNLPNFARNECYIGKATIGKLYCQVENVK